MGPFIWTTIQPPIDMADSAVRTDKRYQLTILGGLALAVVILFGGVQVFLTTTTLQTASLAVMAGFLIALGFLALEL